MAVEIKVPIEELRKRKIFLATPMYGGNATGIFSRSVADLASVCTHYGIGLQLYFLFNESLITRARNYCCDEFMRSESTHLMFIDADIGFNPNDVIALLALASDDSPYDVIAGPYPKKSISWEKIKVAVDKGFAEEDPNNLEKYVGDYVFNPKAGVQNIQINETVEVLEAGTGFMMIRKATMAKFRDAFPEYQFKPDHVRTEAFDGSRKITMFFQAEIDRTNGEKIYKKALNEIIAEGNINDPTKIIEIINNAMAAGNIERSLRYLSEDYWFCQKIQELNMKTWFCPWMKLNHVGTYVFGGSLADLAQVGVAPTADPALLQKVKDRNKAKLVQGPVIKIDPTAFAKQTPIAPLPTTIQAPVLDPSITPEVKT